jgi:hypothetical protein
MIQGTLSVTVRVNHGKAGTLSDILSVTLMELDISVWLARPKMYFQKRDLHEQ